MLTNDVLDLVSGNVDVALRIGASNPKDALSRGALDMRVGLYPSAGYLGTHGTLQAIDDIATLIGPRRAELRRLLLQLPGRRGARIRSRPTTFPSCGSSSCSAKASDCCRHRYANPTLQPAPSLRFSPAVLRNVPIRRSGTESRRLSAGGRRIRTCSTALRGR